MHPSKSRNVRDLMFISRVSSLVYLEVSQVITHLCYPFPIEIDLDRSKKSI